MSISSTVNGRPFCVVLCEQDPEPLVKLCLARQPGQRVDGGTAASLADQPLGDLRLDVAEDLRQAADRAREGSDLAFGDLPSQCLDQQRLERR